jgi:hypothetical protein
MMMFATRVAAVSRMIAHFLDPIDEYEDDQWYAFAQSLPPARFVVWLANEVTTGLVTDTPTDNIDAVIGAVEDNRTGTLQNDAERFLKQHYGMFHFDSNACRVVLVFRELVQHKLRHSK